MPRISVPPMNCPPPDVPGAGCDLLLRSGMRRWSLLLALWLGLVSPWLQADSAAARRWQVGGFITQALVSSDANRFAGNSASGVSTQLREIALYASGQPRANLRLAGQVMSRRAGQVDDGQPRIDYLLADLSLASQPHNSYGLRIGRLKSPLGFYNDTRDVAFTRPSIMLPQSVYFDRARNLELSVDGMMFYGHYPLPGNLRLDVDLLGGYTRKDRNVEYAYFWDDLPGYFQRGAGIMGRFIVGMMPSAGAVPSPWGISNWITRLRHRP